MRLRSVQRTTTAVFEIDLCEVGDGQFVVNFRHGKRGGKLVDGTKTILPVGRDEAERTFNKLVQDKKRKGYVDADAGLGGLPGATAAPTRERVEVDTAGLDGRAATLVRYLEDRGRPREFPLHRVIWRAGELRLRAAVPALLELLRKGHKQLGRRRGPPWQYGLVWALARTADPRAVDALQQARRDAKLDAATRRVASVGLLDALDGEARATFVREQTDALPSAVASALADGADPLRAAVAAHLASADQNRHDVLFALYLVDHEAARAVVLEQLRALSLRSAGFRVARWLLKAAELRGDGEVFGVLALRFETTRSNHQEWGRRGHGTPFQPGTRRYLRRRSWRTLRRLGELGVEEYVDLAVGVLLAVTDSDGRDGRHDDSGFTHLWPVAQILFHNDARFEKTLRGLKLYPRRDAGEPAERGDAYPGLWDAQPNALVALMRRSRCGAVHRFAARAYRRNPGAWSSLDTAVLIELLRSRYESTVRLMADIGVDRYAPGRPDLVLVLALATCMLPDVRKTAHTWISANPRPYLDDPSFTVSLALAEHHDTRLFARTLLGSALMVPSTAQDFVARLLSELLAGDRPAELLQELGRDVEALLSTTFSSHARSLGLDVIRDLLAHPEEGVQHLAATLLLAHDTRPADLPHGLLSTVMLSAHASVRALGVRLFGELPDATLIDRHAVLVDLCSNPHVEVRQAVRPIVGRLGRSHPPFAATLLQGLIDVLAEPEGQEGLHADVVALIRGELQQALTNLELPLVWKLLQAPSGVAQELGGQLLERNVRPDALEVWRIAKLASHDIRAVRQAAWRMYREGINRVRRDMETGLLILDAKWDDSREFAFEFFEQHFGAAEFTPRLLVSVCDSVRPDVQQYGRRLITKFFSEVDGPKYLLELSQHPATDMQLFATNYLERYATGGPERIASLRWYFNAVLTGVNRGRAAKKRVLAFLRAEAVRDSGVARLVADMLGELARAIAVEYRASAIEVLNEIRRRYPDIDVPLTVRLPARRPRRAV